MRKAVRQRFPYTDALWLRPKTEADWLAERQNDVTATDAAALFGVSPYCTPFELYHRKAGNLTVEFETTERMRWGQRLQDAIARGICEDRGWKIINAEPYLYVRSARFVGMGASPDYIVFDPDRGPGMLEIKNVDKFVGLDDWSEVDEAPVHIEFQIQHQLECSELPWGAIGGLIGGNEARVIVRERDTEVGIELGQRVTDLWRRVRDKDAPAPDYLKDYDSVRRLYKHADVGSVLSLDLAEPDDAQVKRLLELCAAEREAALRGKLAKEDRERAQAEVLTIIQDHETVTGLPGFKVRAATQHREERTQTVKAFSFRDLRITAEKPPKPKADKKAAQV
jgi:putative phage-type endonuclease